MRKRPIKKVGIFLRPDFHRAKIWNRKIEKWITKNYPNIQITDKAFDTLIVLGGDGTVLDAVQKYFRTNVRLFPLNLGTIGFLSSVRKSKYFVEGLVRLMEGEWWEISHIMAGAQVKRNGKLIHTARALNDIVVQSLVGMVNIQVSIEGYPYQHIRGTGVLISTPTGSTAFNLSAHGPIVMPDIESLIITELLDHNTPTPPLVAKASQHITLKIISARKYQRFSLKKTGEPLDIALIADNNDPFVLEEGDEIVVSRAKYKINFLEVFEHNFLKGIQEKFTFK